MNKDVTSSLGWGAAVIACALGASTARELGYIDSESVTRIVMGLTGLMVAALGNRMPKALAPSECARQIARVGGWSLALSGLVYAGLWALAPVDTAIVGGCAAVIAGIAVTLGYSLSLRSRAKAS